MSGGKGRKKPREAAVGGGKSLRGCYYTILHGKDGKRDKKGWVALGAEEEVEARRIGGGKVTPMADVY